MQWKGQQDLDPLRAAALVSLSHIGARGGSLKPASFHVSGWGLESTDPLYERHCQGGSGPAY